MADMEASVEMSATCILACGVLLPPAATRMPEVFSKVASPARPDNTSGIGLVLEPRLRPPRATE